MRHQTISFIKSGIRIAGYVALGAMTVVSFEAGPSTLVLAACLLVMSEIIGIIEEIGHE